jgi:hypothetical protein
LQFDNGRRSHYLHPESAVRRAAYLALIGYCKWAEVHRKSPARLLYNVVRQRKSNHIYIERFGR